MKLFSSRRIGSYFKGIFHSRVWFDLFLFFIVRDFLAYGLSSTILARYSGLIVNLFFSLYLICFYSKYLKENLVDLKKNKGRYFYIILWCFVFNAFVFLINDFLIPKISPTSFRKEKVDSIIYLIIHMTTIAVLVPFVEEMIFRKGMTKLFYKITRSKFITYILVIAFFCFAHSYFRFSSLVESINSIRLLLDSIMFTLVYFCTGNIFLSTFVHMFHNLLVIVYLI